VTASLAVEVARRLCIVLLEIVSIGENVVASLAVRMPIRVNVVLCELPFIPPVKTAVRTVQVRLRIGEVLLKSLYVIEVTVAFRTKEMLIRVVVYKRSFIVTELLALWAIEVRSPGVPDVIFDGMTCSTPSPQGTVEVSYVNECQFSIRRNRGSGRLTSWN